MVFWAIEQWRRDREKRAAEAQNRVLDELASLARQQPESDIAPSWRRYVRGRGGSLAKSENAGRRQSATGYSRLGQQSRRKSSAA